MRSAWNNFLVLVALTASVPTISAAAATQVPAGLRESPPVVCRGTEDIVLRNRYIKTDGNAVEVRGNCDVEIIGSHIVAGGVGVLLAMNGDVTIEDSYIEGAKGGLIITANGDIEYRNSTVRGGTRVFGNGELIDLGGNDVDGFAGSDPPAGSGDAAEVSIGPGGIRVEDAEGNVVITGPGGVRVKSGGEVVDVTPGGVHARSDGDEVRVSPGGRITVTNDVETVVVDSDYVSVRPASPRASGDWRISSGDPAASDTGRILVDLGAKETDGRIELSLAGDVLFDFDSADIRPEAAIELSKLAHVLRQRAEGDIVVEGHTDSLGGDAYNHTLSEQRAISVMHWLNAHESIPAHLMKGRGMGSKKPTAYNTMPDGSDNPEGRAKNRRVEIRFTSR